MELEGIVVDKHEPASIIFALKQSNLPIKEEFLELGDYLISDLVIERKTTEDLINSIRSGRLWNQLYDLKNNYPKVILAITGSIPDTRWEQLGGRRVEVKLNYEERQSIRRTINSAIVTAFLSYNATVLQFGNDDDFAEFLKQIYFKSSKKEVSLKPVVRKKAYSIEDIRFNIYSSIPFLGRKLADNLSKLVSVRELSRMTVEEIQDKFEGIGQKRAEWIVKSLS